MEKYVCVGQYKIIKRRYGPLRTGCISPTSYSVGLCFESDEKQYLFLCHIDEKTDIKPIAKEILSYHPIYKNIDVWHGSEHKSLQTDLLTLIGIKDEKEEKEDVLEFSTYNQCKICDSVSGNLKVISHKWNCIYKKIKNTNKVNLREMVYVI